MLHKHLTDTTQDSCKSLPLAQSKVVHTSELQSFHLTVTYSFPPFSRERKLLLPLQMHIVQGSSRQAETLQSLFQMLAYNLFHLSYLTKLSSCLEAIDTLPALKSCSSRHCLLLADIFSLQMFTWSPTRSSSM